jgi:hypothetical protein
LSAEVSAAAFDGAEAFAAGGNGEGIGRLLPDRLGGGAALIAKALPAPMTVFGAIRGFGRGCSAGRPHGCVPPVGNQEPAEIPPACSLRNSYPYFPPTFLNCARQVSDWYLPLD